MTAAGLVDFPTNEKSASAALSREINPTSPYCCSVTNNSWLGTGNRQTFHVRGIGKSPEIKYDINNDKLKKLPAIYLWSSSLIYVNKKNGKTASLHVQNVPLHLGKNIGTGIIVLLQSVNMLLFY